MGHYHDPLHQIGTNYSWTAGNGVHYEGTIIEIDDGTLIIKCTDGKTRAVQANWKS